MLEFVILGIIQGVLEWLPVSSEGFLVITSSFMSLPNPIDLALYLHMGTMLAVVIYFRSRIVDMIKKPDKQTFFIVKATAVSLVVAFPVYLALKWVSESLAYQAGSILLGLTGIALIVTGFLLRKKTTKKRASFETLDAVYAGFLQGLAVIPGLSRSGVTMFALLSRGYKQDKALETSFLMSVPVVLAAQLFLALNKFGFKSEYLIALVVSFVFGMLAIHYLLTLAKKLNFSWFCWFFGALSLSAFLFLTLS